MDMICNNCKGSISIRVNPFKWTTLKCICKITIIYVEGGIVTKTKEQYLEFKKKKADKNDV